MTASRPHLPVALVALGTAVLTVLVAWGLELPLRDPDGVAGPAYIRLPLVITLLFALDLLPRAAHRARGLRGFVPKLREVAAERWTRRRLALVLVGLISFYLTYVGYRNLKSFLPFANSGVWDRELLELDRAMTLGYEPSQVLHSLLGTGAAAHLLSAVYIFFLLFVPLSLGVALVWSRDLSKGYWYVTALCLNWVIGVATYYVLPSLGPAFAEPALYSELPATGVSHLQEALMDHRVAVLNDPFATSEVHGIAGFASLHVSIVFTAALIAHLMRLPRIVCRSLWLFLGLTAVATIYFGWHYIIDDIAGLAVGAACVWLGAVATGHRALVADAVAGWRRGRIAEPNGVRATS